MSFVDPTGDQGGQKGDIAAKVVKADSAASIAWIIWKNILGVIVTVVAAIYFMAHGLPVYIGVAVIVIVAGAFAASIVVKQRQASALGGSGGAPERAASEIPAIHPAPDEKVVAAIGGIVNTGGGVRSVQVLGAGKIRHPENSMVVTDRNVFLLYVPLPAGDVTAGDVDMGAVYWLIDQVEIAA